MTARADPSIHDLKNGLVARLESVTPQILTDVKAGGMGSYLVGHGLGRKFKVYLRGNKRGLIVDTADPHGREPDRPGRNIFNLLMHVVADGTPRGAAIKAMELLHIPRSGTIEPPDPVQQQRRRDDARRARSATGRA
jgi:hypothetical protein